VSYDQSPATPIPADIERPDKILAGLTGRQVAILAAAFAVLWVAFEATHRYVALPVFAGAAAPVVVVAVVLATGQRDGLSFDRLLLAAWRQSRSPRRLAHAPEGVPAPPAVPGVKPPPPPAAARSLFGGITPEGVVEDADGGAVVVCAVSTVNFALRTPPEQDALTSGWARYLNSLTGPVQVVVRAGRADLTPAVTALQEAAPGLPHPALEEAALEHAAFLAELAATRDVLTRQVLLAVTEPTPTRARGGGAAGARVAQRAGEAARLLAGADVTVSVLDGPQVTALLAAATDPAAPITAARLAVPGQPVTSPGGAT